MLRDHSEAERTMRAFDTIFTAYLTIFFIQPPVRPRVSNVGATCV